MGRFANRDEFCRIAQCHVERDLIKMLGVTEKTFKSWKAGSSRIPWSAYQLAFDRSPYGLAERDSMEGFNRRTMQALIDALQAKVDRLEAELVRITSMVDWGCANDPFITPTDPRVKAFLTL